MDKIKALQKRINLLETTLYDVKELLKTHDRTGKVTKDAMMRHVFFIEDILKSKEVI